MKTRRVIEREGENMGPVDWEHPHAKQISNVLRAIFRELVKNPKAYRYSPSGFTTFEIIDVCMYDGWPYWTPTPAFSYIGPLGSIEWQFFNGYGVNVHAFVTQRSPLDGPAKH